MSSTEAIIVPIIFKKSLLSKIQCHPSLARQYFNKIMTSGPHGLFPGIFDPTRRSRTMFYLNDCNSTSKGLSTVIGNKLGLYPPPFQSQYILSFCIIQSYKCGTFSVNIELEPGSIWTTLV